jgi:hypothetical protein
MSDESDPASLKTEHKLCQLYRKGFVEERNRLVQELAGARATIEHMAKAAWWISGHDRQGQDHLEEAEYDRRALEATVIQARKWAALAKEAKADADRGWDDAQKRQDEAESWAGHWKSVNQAYSILHNRMAAVRRVAQAWADVVSDPDCPAEDDEGFQELMATMGGVLIQLLDSGEIKEES